MSNYLRFTLANADFSALGIGKFAPLPDLNASLYAAYMLGTNYGSTPLADLSGAGRTLSQVGGGIGAQALAATPTSYLSTPFTAATLLSVSGAATVMAVAQVGPSPGGSGFIEASAFNVNSSPSVPGLALAAGATSAKTLSVYDYGGSSSEVDLSSSTARDTTFEVHAATWSAGGMAAYRRRASYSAGEYASNSTGITTPGVQAFRIGADYGSTFSGSGQIAAMFFGTAALTQAQLDAQYLIIQALMAKYGLAV